MLKAPFSASGALSIYISLPFVLLIRGGVYCTDILHYTLAYGPWRGINQSFCCYTGRDITTKAFSPENRAKQVHSSFGFGGEAATDSSALPGSKSC